MSLKVCNVLRRTLSTKSSRVPQVCIVGAGPAGFYAAMHITKNFGPVNVDIYEKLPVPFGLIRYGVAPDHPEVKNVINQFTKVAKQPNVNFYGNVTLGRDIKLSQLRQHYDAVLLTYGAEEDKTLGIENEDVPGVVAARKFVGWYNGLPGDKDLKIDLSCDTAAVLGQGNVALDVARILLTPIDELRKTDITEHALNTLAESKIKELYLIGRRGPLQVAFTIKELREQLKLKNCKTIWRDSDFNGISEIVPTLQRPRKRLTELMLKSYNESKDQPSDGKKLFNPVFFRSPSKFLGDTNRNLTGIELVCNKLVGDKHKFEDQKCVPTDEMEIIKCGLAFRSIGYQSIKADEELVFANGLVANNRGCVDNNSSELAKLYVAGWLGTGPVGVILNTMGNAFHVAKIMCEDLKNIDLSENRYGFEEVKRTILTNHNDIISWPQWEKIDKYEIDQGKAKGKPREKICDVKQMIEISK